MTGTTQGYRVAAEGDTERVVITHRLGDLHVRYHRCEAQTDPDLHPDAKPWDLVLDMHLSEPSEVFAALETVPASPDVMAGWWRRSPTPRRRSASSEIDACVNADRRQGRADGGRRRGR